MDIPAAAAAPWLVLGLALGIALVVLIGSAVAVARSRPRHRAGMTGPAVLPPEDAHPPAGTYVEDDLPGFLDSPPGSSSGAPASPEGWPALSAAPPSPSRATSSAPAVATTPARGPVGVLVAMALATLLLVAAAAAVATARTPDAAPPAGAGDGGTPAVPQEDRPSSAPPAGSAAAGDLADASVPPGDDGAVAELTFGGVVLERHAVGVTATYPVVDVTWNGDQAVAHVELPTFNCLRDQAPDDPVAAGCSRSLTEYADLVGGGLDVRRDGDRLVLTGTFRTYLRPNGTTPAWTGRRYELLVTAEPERRGSGWRPAQGVLALGDDSAQTTGAEANRIRFGG